MVRLWKRFVLDDRCHRNVYRGLSQWGLCCGNGGWGFVSGYYFSVAFVGVEETVVVLVVIKRHLL